MPHKIFIVMGQGACGDLRQISVCSGTFYTCSGIAMANTNIGRGGLYHYPAEALTDPDDDQFNETSDSLKQMLGYILPNAIRIVTARNALEGMGGMAEEAGGGTSRRDKSAMVNWFQQLGFNAQLYAEATWAGLSSRGVSTNAGDGVWPAGNLHDWQGKPAGVHNLNGTNVTVVGKSGERERIDPSG